MTSSNGSIFRVIGHLCGEFTGHIYVNIIELCFDTRKLISEGTYYFVCFTWKFLAWQQRAYGFNLHISIEIFVIDNDEIAPLVYSIMKSHMLNKQDVRVMWKNLYYLCHLRVEKWYKMCGLIFGADYEIFWRIFNRKCIGLEWFVSSVKPIDRTHGTHFTTFTNY